MLHGGNALHLEHLFLCNTKYTLRNNSTSKFILLTVTNTWMDVSKSRARYTCKIINERSHTALHKGAWQFSNRSKQSTALIRNHTVTYSLINKTRLMHTVQHWGNPDQYIYIMRCMRLYCTMLNSVIVSASQSTSMPLNQLPLYL